MAGTNDFKAFATDANANVTSQEEWETLTALKKGFSSGKASSAQVSKALRQPSTMAAVLGQFIANAELDALDDGDVDGLVAKLATAITTNLGLGEAAKMPAATALASSAGNITIPVLIGGVQRTALLQWKTLSVPQSTDGNMVVVDDSWPVAFPNACLSINPSLVNSVIYATNGAPFVSAAIVDRVKFKAACAYTKSNSTVAVWGVGY